LRKLKNSEVGSIAIETLIAFSSFLMFMAVTVTFVNVAAVQLRVHYALTQTAKEISHYSYMLRLLGIANVLAAMDAEGNPALEEIETDTEIDGSLGDIFYFLDAASNTTTNLANANNLSGIVETADGTFAAGQQPWSNDISDSPGEFFASFLWLAVNEGAQIDLAHLMGEVIVPSFFWRYMGIHGGASGMAYFNSMRAFADSVEFIWWDFSWGNLQGGITGNVAPPNGAAFLLNAHGSPNNDEIVLGIRYRMDFTQFFILPDNLRFESEVIQHVKTRAFIGDGGRFSGGD